jgi:hypothetical protein
MNVDPAVYYKIVAKNSGKCLDVTGGPSAVNRNGGQLQQWDYRGGENQQWRLQDLGDGYYAIFVKNTMRCLDVVGGPDAKANGARIQLWDYLGATNQKWRLQDVGGGAVAIIAENSGKCLDVIGGPGATANGTNIQQYEYIGGTNQQWELVVAEARLIGSVRVTPPQAAPGQAVRIEVLSPNGETYTADSDVTIAFDGIPIPSRYYQFPTAGTRTISVYAAGKGTTERATATVTITGAPLAYHRTLFAAGQPPAPGLIPFIVLTQDISTPYQVRFSLATPPAARAAAARAVAAADRANEGRPAPVVPPATQTAPAGFIALQALFPVRPGEAVASERHLVLQSPVNLPVATTSFEWTFGDGQTATTDTPTVTHDYFPAIRPGNVPFAFDVSCRIVHDNITVTRTLVLYSAYGACQRNGTTIPHVTSDVYATLNSDKTAFSASLIVYNIEATAITIDQMAIVPIWRYPLGNFPPVVFTRMTQPITIASQSSSLLAVQVLRSQLSSAARGAAVTGFIAVFQGTLAVKLPSVDVALRNSLRPGMETALPTGAVRTVRFSRNVQLKLQDQQLPAASSVVPKPINVVLETLGNAPAVMSPIARSGGVAIDPATNVVSVALTSPAPSQSEAAQIRHSVLSVLNTANTPGGTR